MATRPNILLVMADQLAAPVLPSYGGRVVRAPNLARLAESGIVFENAYCNSPICAPSRFSMLTGRLPTSIDAFDNASELPASLPTLAHYLSGAGYRTILCGKMHFIGPDQLHGYEERLTTDIYPADFAWTPNWLAGPRDRPSGISMQGIIQAGTCVRSLQMDYDDEVEFHARQKLFDLARRPEERPFFLTVSFTHPHPPFTIHREWWDRYTDEEIDAPKVPPIPFAARDAQSQWLHLSHSADRQEVTDAHLRNARHAYYGMVSYLDDKIGRIMSTLADAGLEQDTVVVFASDHGEMLGERGMWYKQTFFEWSARVPLLFAWPGQFAPRRVREVVSLIDLLPTLVELGGEGRSPEWIDPIDGRSLRPLLEGGSEGPGSAISEYTDMGVCAPCRMLRDGNYKYVYTHGHPPQLYDLVADPDELTNIAGERDSARIEAGLRHAALQAWDPDELTRRVLASQRRRLFLQDVARQSGRYPDWSYQAMQDDHHRFVRSSGATGAKARARFPFVPPLE
jgi:choline-sulfatase